MKKYGLKEVIFPVDLIFNKCDFSHNNVTFPHLHYKYEESYVKVNVFNAEKQILLS